MSGLTSAATREEQIEEGLEHSRVLVLCMSANAFGLDPGVPGLEAGTCGKDNDGSRNLRFRDPLKQERRFRSSDFDIPIWKIKPSCT